MNTLDQIKAIVGDKAGIPASDVQDDAWLGRGIDLRGADRQHLDLDSADRLELAMDIEDRFSIEISDEQSDKPEMGTPAGIAAFVDKMRTGEYAAGGIIHEPGTGGEQPGEDAMVSHAVPADSAWQPSDMTAVQVGADTYVFASNETADATPVESDELANDRDPAKFAESFMSGATMDNPLGRALRGYPDSGHQEALAGIMKVWFARTFEAGRSAALASGITREELIGRGLAENLGGAVMDIVMKLGFPTDEHPMGSDPTHALVPLDQVSDEEDATEVLSFRNWVKFLHIEHGAPHAQIHFDHPAEQTPEWLIEACSRPEDDIGAIWAKEGVLFAKTAAGTVPVLPGSIIRRVVIEQLAIEAPEQPWQEGDSTAISA